MDTFYGRLRHGVLHAVVAILSLSLATGLAIAQDQSEEESANTQVHVENWLVLEPTAIPLPAFADEGKDKVKAKDLLAYEHVSLRDLRPIADGTVNLIGGTTAWRAAEADADTLGIALTPQGDLPNVAYLATYVEVPRWMKVKIEARSNSLFELTIDGESQIKQDKAPKPDKIDQKSATAKLEVGTHLLIVKALFAPSDSLDDWHIDVRLSAEKDFEDDPMLSLDPSRTMNITDILDVPVMNGVSVSPDGTLFALRMSKRNPPEGKSRRWIEIRQFKDGNLLRTLEDMSGVSNWQWAPTGNRLSYSVAKDKAGTVRVVDLDTGTIETIVENVKEFSGYDWSPDGTYITYSVDKPAEKDETGIKRMQGVYDRRHYERDRTSLYLSSVPSGITRKLTAGEYSTRVYDIHPDSRSMLIGRSYEDLEDRPYSKTELILLTLEDQQTEILWTGRFLGGATWSPDGTKILITGGPSAFGDVGKDLPAGEIANDYDTQAYLFDPETKAVDPITKDFDPTIESVFWPKPGTDIYFLVEEGEYNKLYRYNIKKGKYANVPLESDVTRARSAARDKPLAVFTGAGANEPWRLYAIDMKRGKVKTLLEPGAERFAQVKLGSVEDWNFNARSGKEIVGRIHYPPNFDAAKKWPCIVYYYGGTSPVTRSFGGRYPKNLWAANGYVVYVLQPSGATGFGQEFSARHVNDWGKITADEIIEGTKKFLDAHDFVDADRVGCIGASFGGFMTQLVVTKTTVFAGAVSHAGISDISSYWGEGYWGYGYNAVSAANSFPWNRPDIYVEQSPLFSADKIDTPLLLLHGAADTNVPRGESDQMYAALKLLGKEVEYIRVAGQNHWIVDYKKRIAWSNAILAWFDRWLKGESEWWNDMFPPVDGAGESGDEAGRPVGLGE